MKKFRLALLLTWSWTLFPALAYAGEQPGPASPRMAIGVLTVTGVRYFPMPSGSDGGEMMFTPFPRSITRVRLNYWMEKSGLLVLRCATIRYEGNNWPRDESLWTRVAEFRMRPRIGETLADKRLADLGVTKVAITTALSPVPNPPRVWTSVRTIQAIDIREEFRGQYKVTLRNNSSEAIQGLALRHADGVTDGITSIGLRDEDRVVPAGGAFTERSSCYPRGQCELEVRASLSARGTCTGEVEPCRLLMAQWRGRQIAARLMLPVLEEARHREAIDTTRLAEAIRAVNVAGSLTGPANDIMRSTRAPAKSRRDVERHLLWGANGLVNSLMERLVDPGYSAPAGDPNRNIATDALQHLIDKCIRIVSNPSPSNNDRFRL